MAGAGGAGGAGDGARDVCVVGYARTPIGAYGGSLASVSAVDLGAHAIECTFRPCIVAASGAVLRRCGVGYARCPTLTPPPLGFSGCVADSCTWALQRGRRGGRGGIHG